MPPSQRFEGAWRDDDPGHHLPNVWQGPHANVERHPGWPLAHLCRLPRIEPFTAESEPFKSPVSLAIDRTGIKPSTRKEHIMTATDSVQTTMLRQELKAQQDALATAAHPRAIELEIARLEQRVALSEERDARVAQMEADRETDRRCS